MNNYLFWKRFAQGKLKTHVSSVKIRIPSPKEILSWSERRLPNSTLIGKIDNAHTVEHDTLRPVSGGLFCERIFGPIATNVCACLRRKGWNEEYCKVCEVQFTKSRLRRYQMGHILLAAPVVHIWALQGGYLASLLGKKNLSIRSIAYGKVMCQSKLWVDETDSDSDTFFDASKACTTISNGNSGNASQAHRVAATFFDASKACTAGGKHRYQRYQWQCGNKGTGFNYSINNQDTFVENYFSIPPKVVSSPFTVLPANAMKVVDPMDHKVTMRMRTPKASKPWISENVSKKMGFDTALLPAVQAKHTFYDKIKDFNETATATATEGGSGSFNVASKKVAANTACNKSSIFKISTSVNERRSIETYLSKQDDIYPQKFYKCYYDKRVLFGAKKENFHSNRLTQLRIVSTKGTLGSKAQGSTVYVINQKIGKTVPANKTVKPKMADINKQVECDKIFYATRPHHDHASKKARWCNKQEDLNVLLSKNFAEKTYSVRDKINPLLLSHTGIFYKKKTWFIKKESINYQMQKAYERKNALPFHQFILYKPDAFDKITQFFNSLDKEKVNFPLPHYSKQKFFFYSNSNLYKNFHNNLRTKTKTTSLRRNQDFVDHVYTDHGNINTFRKSENQNKVYTLDTLTLQTKSKSSTLRARTACKKSWIFKPTSKAKYFGVVGCKPRLRTRDVEDAATFGGSVENFKEATALHDAKMQRYAVPVSQNQKDTVRNFGVFNQIDVLNWSILSFYKKQVQLVAIKSSLIPPTFASEIFDFKGNVVSSSFISPTFASEIFDFKGNVVPSSSSTSYACTKSKISAQSKLLKKVDYETIQSNRLPSFADQSIINGKVVKWKNGNKQLPFITYHLSNLPLTNQQNLVRLTQASINNKWLEASQVRPLPMPPPTPKVAVAVAASATKSSTLPPKVFAAGSAMYLPKANLTSKAHCHRRWRCRIEEGGSNAASSTIQKIASKQNKKNKLTDVKNVAYTGSSVLFQTLKNFNLVLLNSLINWKWKKAKAQLNCFLLQNKLTKKKRNLRNKLAKIKIVLTKRRILVKSFLNTRQLPEWMILSILPVLPPALRPILELEPNNVVVSDLNVLYQTVIRRNDALMGLLTFRALEVDILNRQVSLQQAIEKLFDKGAGTKKRPVKSLSQGFHGKKGLFRSHLLGKRVDYSGRSVIVVGPQLKLHECGLPKEMALVLFLPFLIARLKKRKIVNNTSQAKQLVFNKDKQIWSHLKSLIYEHPVLLNRAPTLHRLGFQAFQPILVSGKAMILPALVCTGFNADFDGDQMAVHVPLSHIARAESWKLLHAKNNMLSPATGKPIIVLSQEMILGCYCSSLVLNQTFISQSRINKTHYLHQTILPSLTTLRVRQNNAASKPLFKPMPLLIPSLKQANTEGGGVASKKVAAPLPASASVSEDEDKTEKFKVKDNKNFYFTTFQEIHKALGQNRINIQTAVWLRIPFFEDNQFLEQPLEIRLDAMGHFFRSYCQSQRHFSKNIKSRDQMKGISYIRTSVGRIQLNETFYSSLSP